MAVRPCGDPPALDFTAAPSAAAIRSNTSSHSPSRRWRKSRIVGCIPGHYTWTFDDPLYRVLVLRSISGVARQEDVDRLSELAVIGARTAP